MMSDLMDEMHAAYLLDCTLEAIIAGHGRIVKRERSLFREEKGRHEGVRICLSLRVVVSF